MDIAKTKGAMVCDIDVVITHDWPSGIRNWKGTDLIRSLTETLEPQLHVCGHLHASHEAVIGKTTVHALDAVLGAKHGDDRYGWWRLCRNEDGQIGQVLVGS